MQFSVALSSSPLIQGGLKVAFVKNFIMFISHCQPLVHRLTYVNIFKIFHSKDRPMPVFRKEALVLPRWPDCVGIWFFLSFIHFEIISNIVCVLSRLLGHP